MRSVDGKPAGGRIVAVARRADHRFSKDLAGEIVLVAGLGVEDDAHQGETVRHRSRVRVDPTRPNLRQVHLLQAELLEELARRGFDVTPGELGENVTTAGIDLLGLPTGTLLRLGAEAEIEVTGLRNPCSQIEAFRTGLLAAVLGRDAQGRLVRKAGIMAVVRGAGVVRAGDAIVIELPHEPHQRLEPV